MPLLVAIFIAQDCPPSRCGSPRLLSAKQGCRMLILLGTSYLAWGTKKSPHVNGMRPVGSHAGYGIHFPGWKRLSSSTRIDLNEN